MWGIAMLPRQDVLAAFAMEEAITPAMLKTYLAQYPHHADDLLDLYNELVMGDLEVERAELLFETKAMTSINLNVSQVEAALFGDGVRDLAARLSLPRSFLMGLQASVVRIGSLPAPFLKKLAGEIGVRTQDVVSGMQRGGHQTFALKSETKPGVNDPIAFNEYVELAGLSEDQRNVIDKMTGTDGPR